MKLHKRPIITGIAMLIVTMALALTGCGRENAVTTPDGVADVELVADPLDGVLNSTLEYTPPDPRHRIDRLAEILGLDPEQKEALLAAYLEFRIGITALKDQVRSGDLSMEEAREQAAALREAFEAELQIILTPEQYDQLQEMRQNRHVRRQGHRSLHDRWAAWLDEIGADAEQVAAVMTALDIFRDGIRDLHLAVRSGDMTREEAILVARALRADFEEALQTILTPEQYAALQELRPDCGGR